MDAAELASLSFFESFERAALDKIAALGEPVEAEPGAVITEQGSVGREAYVVRSGEVQIVVNGEIAATVGPGSVLGEMSLLELRPRSATLKAVGAVQLVAFDAKRFRAVIDEMSPEDRSRLAERDARFREQNETIADDGRPRRIGG